VIGDEPFGYIRYDAQYRKAEELRRSGRPIRIVSERQLIDELAAFA
jgi:DNA polymerase-3 subunit epsilon